MKELVTALLLALSLSTGIAGGTGCIYVGDSRTVGMDNVVGLEDDNVFVAAKAGEGYDWFVDEGFDQVTGIIEEHPEFEDWAIITNFGVNDLHNAGKYAALYEELSEYVDVYAVSVNPCSGSYRKWNSLIMEFNQTLAGTEGVTFIDTHSVLSEEGFVSHDGLHYGKKTYERIHEIIDSELE